GGAAGVPEPRRARADEADHHLGLLRGEGAGPLRATRGALAPRPSGASWLRPTSRLRLAQRLRDRNAIRQGISPGGVRYRILDGLRILSYLGWILGRRHGVGRLADSHRD